MKPDNFLLKPIVNKIATDAEIEAIWHFGKKMTNESSPDTPFSSIDILKKSYENQPSFQTLDKWYLYDKSKSEDTIVANVVTEINDTEENQHLAFARVGVLAEYRNQGIANYLLPKILEAAQKHNRRLIMGVTTSTVPSGEVFAEHIGAKAGLPMHENQLELSNLNTDLMVEWRNRYNKVSDQFELILWDDGMPLEEMAAFCQLYEAMNAAPTDDLDVEDETLTPERLKETLAQTKAMGIQEWIMLAKHRGDKEYAGYTELFFNPEKERFLQQGDTAVVAKYRGNNLGKILKAKNLEAVMKVVSTVEYVRTTNAMSNEAMLKINTEMGFKPYKSSIIWELEVDALEKYLKS